LPAVACPSSQLFPCENSDHYVFERNRLGKAQSSTYQNYGPYLYRNVKNKVLISSWEAPTGKNTYTGYEIGTNTDALVYYKNV
jgi:hypothetical protein